MKKNMYLKEKIYLLTYGKPEYKAKVSNILYGRESKTIYPEFKKLEQNNWIKEIDYDYEPDKLAGKRAKRRIYYQANVEPLLNNICNELEKIALINKDNTKRITKEEKIKLKNFFADESFRIFIQSLIDNVNLYYIINPFSFVRSFIGIHCLYLHTVNKHCQHAYNSNNNYTTIARKIFDQVYNKYIEPWNGKDIKEIDPNEIKKCEDIIINVNFIQLGELLIEKLANLTSGSPNLLGVYFDALIITGENITMKQNKIEKKTNGNGHGLS